MTLNEMIFKRKAALTCTPSGRTESGIWCVTVMALLF